MPFTELTAKEIGEATRQEFANAIIDNLNDLNSSVGIIANTQISNGSFENGITPNTAPTGWDITIAAGNTTAFETSAANTRHGKQAFSMTTAGSSGGVTLISENFLLSAEAISVTLGWFMKATTATTTTTINLKFYDEAESLLSTAELFDSSTANPTSWTEFSNSAIAPASAKLVKVEVIGVNSTTPATLYIDGMALEAAEVGTVEMFAASTAPVGWLFCDASAVSRVTYAALFDTIGTTFGIGDGSTTFNVPDMRSRAPIGVGDGGAGLTNRTLADKVGVETHPLTTAELASHTHVQKFSTTLGGGGAVTALMDADIASPSDGIVTGATGSGSGHQNMQPSLAMNFIIRH